MVDMSLDLTLKIFGEPTETSTPSQTLPVLIDNDKGLIEEIVTQLDLSYWRDGSYPDQEFLQKKFNIGPKTLFSFEQKLNEILEKRQLPRIELNSNPVGSRTPEADLDKLFVVATSLICDTLDKRSRAAKLKAIGLQNAKFQRLLQDKAHAEYFRLRVDKAFAGTHESAKLSLQRNVEAGDLPSIKYYHEYTGEHDPNQQTVINLNKIISLLMEILVRHVNTDVIETIGREFDAKILELEK